jgi:hypothetical protein
MAKAEISWRRTDEDGQKLQVYAHHVGNRWIFYHRSRRYDNWQEVENPPVEDWIELLDSVKRRVARLLLRPEEIDRVTKSIRERFPNSILE